MKEFKFDGFEPANTTPVPDVFFDELLPYLSEAQLKTLLYIIRRTLGFKKTSDAISLKQFRFGIKTRDGKQLDKGCGLKNFTSITKALDDLVEIGCIERVKGETDEGDPATTLYRIRFRGTTANGVPTTPNAVPTTGSSGGTPLEGVPPLRQTEGGYYAKRRAGTTPNGATRNSNTKDSNTINRGQEERENDETPTSPPSAASSHTHSSVHSVSFLASNAAQSVASSSTHQLPIVTLPDTASLAEATELPDSDASLQAETQPNETQGATQEDMLPVDGYTNGEMHIDAERGDSVLSGRAIQTSTVLPNATPQSCVTPMEEVKTVTQEMLIEWVKGVKGPEGQTLIRLPKGPMRLQDAIDKLLPLVKCEEHIHELYTIARAQFKDGRPVYLGNLANDDVLEEFEKMRAETGPLEVIELPTISTIMALDAKIKADYPTLFTQPINDEKWGIALLIWYGPTGDDYLFVRDLADWEYWQEDKGMMERAMAYGDYIASPREEVVAV